MARTLRGTSIAVVGVLLFGLVVLVSRLLHEREQAALEGLAVEVLRKTQPTWSATRSGPLQLHVKIGDTAATMHLDNAANMAAGNRERFQELVAESALNLADALEDRPPASFEAVRPRLRPVLVSASFAAAQGVARRPFAGDVVEAWVLDSPRRMTYVTTGQPALWKVDLSEIHDAASQALWQLTQTDALKTDPGAPGQLIVLTTDDHYAASRLAVLAVRDAIAKELGSPFYAAVPDRETLLACSAAYPRALFAARTKERFEHAPYSISEQVFRIEGNGVAVEPNP